MRRAQVNPVLSVIIQLVIFAGLAALFIPFANDAVNMQLYKEEAYATDSVILGETLFAPQTGTVRITYPLSELAYKFTVDQTGVLKVQDIRTDRTATTRRMLYDERVSIAESEFLPVSFEWVRSKTQLSVDGVDTDRSCPEPGEPIWQDATVTAAGHPRAGHILESGTLGLRTAVRYYATYRSGGQGGFILSFDDEQIQIRHAPDALASRIACLMANNLEREGFGIPPVVPDTTLADHVVSIDMGETDASDRGYENPLICALKMAFTEEAPNGC